MLYEAYRPRKWDDLVGQDKVRQRIEALRGRGLNGRAYWISGASGTGKTTVARLLAAEIADPEFVIEFDSADQLRQGDVDDIAHYMALSATGKGGRVWIINEAHGLRKPVIRQLLGILERLPGHVAVIFTTTRDGQDSLFEEEIDAHPLLSRCIVFALTNQGLSRPFAERAKWIAQREGLDGQPIEKYVKLVQRCRNNMRAVLQAVDSGEMLEP